MVTIRESSAFFNNFFGEAMVRCPYLSRFKEGSYGVYTNVLIVALTGRISYHRDSHHP
jgi:hypothetical protein